MKGPQCSFAFDLMRMKTTLNSLRTHFHFATSNENGDRRNLVSFCFTYSEYENEMKSHSEPFFMLVTSMKKASNETRGHFVIV